MAFVARTLERFDLGDRWSYHAWHGEDVITASARLPLATRSKMPLR